MDKGTYCLIFRNPACSVRVGALGEVFFEAGFHIYVGSALGGGGLKRLDRHLALAETPDRHPKWHIDYLLTDPRFPLKSALYAVDPERWECRIASALETEGTSGFGCSDCHCRSHLFHRASDPQEEIAEVFRKFGLAPVIKKLLKNETKANI